MIFTTFPVSNTVIMFKPFVIGTNHILCSAGSLTVDLIGYNDNVICIQDLFVRSCIYAMISFNFFPQKMQNILWKFSAFLCLSRRLDLAFLLEAWPKRTILRQDRFHVLMILTILWLLNLMWIRHGAIKIWFQAGSYFLLMLFLLQLLFWQNSSLMTWEPNDEQIFCYLDM